MRDVTVVLKYEIPAIRNSDFLTGNHTCILKYLLFKIYSTICRWKTLQLLRYDGMRCLSDNHTTK